MNLRKLLRARENPFAELYPRRSIISRLVNMSRTCAGTAMVPTETPQMNLPTKRMVTFLERPMTSQPMHRGITDSCRLFRRPIASMNTPDSSEPMGVARLWTEAADNETTIKRNKPYMRNNKIDRKSFINNL